MTSQAPQKKKAIIVTDPPKFDLEGYIQNYSGKDINVHSHVCMSNDLSAGRTRIERLLLIGNTSTFLEVEALKSAVQEAKKGSDVKKYNQAVEDLRRVGPNEPEAKHDHQWVAATERKTSDETARLEAELKGYKNNLIKESIRVCFFGGSAVDELEARLLTGSRWAMKSWEYTIRQLEI